MSAYSMSGTSSRTSSSTSALGTFSNTNPARGSRVSASPTRNPASRSGPATCTTRSSSACATTSARSSSSSSFSTTTSPARSKARAATTLNASLSMTSWPGRSWETSTDGLQATRILRPALITSTVSSSASARNSPKVFGGCASRSTSALRATICSRASRSVATSRSFWAVSWLTWARSLVSCSAAIPGRPELSSSTSCCRRAISCRSADSSAAGPGSCPVIRASRRPWGATIRQ